jgi:hypothetical protein
LWTALALQGRLGGWPGKRVGAEGEAGTGLLLPEAVDSEFNPSERLMTASQGTGGDEDFADVAGAGILRDGVEEIVRDVSLVRHAGINPHTAL